MHRYSYEQGSRVFSRENLLDRLVLLARVGVLGFLLAPQIAGCATYRGVAEFSDYRQSYTSAADLGNDILDRVAVGERALYEHAYPFDPKLTSFDPNVASYYVESVDPPATAAYRKTLKAVLAYNDALYGLASGEDAAALAGKITRLSAIGSGAVADIANLTAVSGTSAGVATVAAAKTVNTVLAGLEPLTAKVIGFRFRSDFRMRLLEQAPTIRKAIETARTTTPEVFDKLRFPIIQRADSDPSRYGALTQSEIEEIRRNNKLVSTWVVLLDASRAALDVAIAAAEEDGEAGSFDGVLLASEQLAQAVGAARRNLAGAE